jgi:hypothetical protein
MVFKKAIMRKLLYLLFAISLLGCDSDDNVYASVPTFLEKYDGVMWRVDNFPPNHTNYAEYLTFKNSNEVLDKVFMKEIFVNYQQDYVECDRRTLGYSVEDNTTISLIENEDKLVIEFKDGNTQNKRSFFFNVTNDKLSTNLYPGITYSVTDYEDPCD